jgi:DNA-binding protein HU-beta
MTKQDLINSAASTAGVTKKDAAAVLDALLESVTKSLKKGESVTITGFGTFRVSKRAARTGVNPRNPGEKNQDPCNEASCFQSW